MKNRYEPNGAVAVLSSLVVLCALVLMSALADPQTKVDFGLLTCASCHE